MSDQLNLARTALIAGRRSEAQSLFAQLVRSNPQHGEAWYLLGQTLDDPQQRHDCETRAEAAGFVLPVSSRAAHSPATRPPSQPLAAPPPASYALVMPAQEQKPARLLLVGVGLAAFFLLLMVMYAISGGPGGKSAAARPTSVLEQQTPGPLETADYALFEHPETATSAQDFERLGAIHLADKNYPEALAAYNRGLKLDPHWSALYYGRGSAYAEQDEHEKALDDFSEAIYFTGEHDYLPFWARGWEYYELGNFQRAHADFDRAIGLNAADLDLYYARGTAAVQLNLLDSAFIDFTYVIQKKPWTSYSYYGRGYILRKQGKTAAAIRDFESFLENSSDDNELTAEVENILRQLRGQ